MADISEQRINIQAEETAYRAANSESTFTRVGAAVNFINKRQYDSKQFFLNGKYYGQGAPQTDLDGAHMMLFDAEIVGVMMFNLVAGSSGTTTIDIKRRTASGGAGTSIFSVLPSITSAAGNHAFVARRLIPANVLLENPAGTTAPVLSTTNLDAGDLLTIDLTAVQTGGENCGLIIYYRPR
jgi:hypothetical protein